MSDFELQVLSQLQVIVDGVKFIGCAVVAACMAQLWLDQFPREGDK